MKNLLFILLSLPVFSFGQNIWTPFEIRDAQPGGERLIWPEKCRTITLDLSALKTKLAASGDWFDAQTTDNESITLQIPMPDGSFKTFQIWRADVLHPDLAKRFSEIKSYAGYENGHRSTTIRMDVTPFGFHAMILSATENTIFIDPIWGTDTQHYQIYFKKDFGRKNASKFTCLTETGTDLNLPTAANLAENGIVAGDCGKLRRYRIAIACTGEYSAFHGGTVAGALAAMNTTMVRINGIYERELSVTMQILANNDIVVFTNPATDPFDNDDLGQMIDVNQTTCDSKFGTTGYDIGHVFSTGGGGLACLGCPCTSSRATAGTGLGSPVGDPFDVDYVAHEIGHQFGGRHSFNNDCGGNRDPQASAEPGSGSTIMSYAGICAPNVQSFSDDYFHAINLKQMGAFITVGSGNTCPTIINNGNTAPTASATTDKIIPISTPFFLTGAGSDANGDAITYNWDQMDLAIGAVMPPASTNLTGPMFRSLKATSSPTRYFPNLADLAAGVNPTWEELPSLGRPMTFRLTVRDNRAGGGCTAEDEIKITTNTTAGPFVVTAPNVAGIIWNVGSTQNVTWNVANTLGSPINCANVQITLSTDGGLTYPTILAASVPNNGSASVSVPNQVSTTCRVRVESVGNVFFDISDKNFTIKIPVTPTFSMSVTPASQSVCAGTTAAFSIELQAISGFNNPITLSVSGNPFGSTAVFTQNPATPDVPNSLFISNLSANNSANFSITITATSGAITQNQTVILTVLTGAPTATTTLLAPANLSTGIGTAPVLTWNPTANATTYFVQIATNPSFNAASLVGSGTVLSNFPLNNLTPSTVYYWRVRPENNCGQGAFSSPFSFQTGISTCSQTFNSTDVPKTISNLALDSVESILTIPAGWYVTDLNMSATINHTYIGDIGATLIAPNGVARQLFDRPGEPALDQFGCSEDNILANFDDEATQTAAIFEATCNNNTPSISGDFQSIESFSVFDGLEATGNWRLLVTDSYPDDGGQIAAWSITICYASAILPAVILQNQTLTVAKSGQGVIGQNYLLSQFAGTANQAVFTVTALPLHGSILKNGSTLAVGDIFTQAEVNANLVIYQNNGATATTDFFKFDFLDQSNNRWLANKIFNIQIVQNTLAAGLIISQNIACAGAATGAVLASATGGSLPLLYSLNGSNFQQSNSFTGLFAGNYTVVVKDANGFTISTNTVSPVNPAAVLASATVNADDVTAMGSGGTGSLTYSINGQNFSPNPVFQNLANGVYTITVKDANGCTATAQAVVAVNTLLVGAQIQQGITCFGGANGIILVSVGGGQMPFSYKINGGLVQNNPVFSGLSAGSYSIVVTDAQGFSSTSNQIILSQPTAISASISTSFYQIMTTASGGTGALSYSIDGQNYQTSPNFSVAQNGNYTITVRDQSGCTTQVSATISVPVLTATETITMPVSCFGSSDGAILLGANGGQPPYLYSINGVSYQPSAIFTGLSAGIYTISTKDASGTVAFAQFTLSQPNVIQVQVTIFGNSITLAASAGSGGYQYSIDGINFSPNFIFPNLPNGNYIVHVRDINGCEVTRTATINYATMNAILSRTQPTCFGSANGSISAIVSGGIPNYVYALDGQNFQTSETFLGLAAGNYTIHIKDATGTIINQPTNLGQPSAVVISASAVGNVISFQATGGVGNFSYSVDGQSVGASTEYMNATTGLHQISAVDGNGCPGETTVTVFANTLTISTLSVNPGLCNGNSDGSLTVCLNGGQMPFTVSILPNIGLQNSVPGNCASDVQFSQLEPGNYQIMATDAQNFSQVLSISLPEPTAITVDVAVNQNAVTIVGAGGTGGLMYSIDGQNYQSSNLFLNLQDGNYTAFVRDANGCFATTFFQIMIIATDNLPKLEGIKIYPNPTRNTVQLVDNQLVSPFFDCEISDATGRILSKEKIKLPHSIDFGKWPTGVYWLSLNDGQNRLVRKIVRLD